MHHKLTRYVGPVLWLSSIQYYVAQLFVAAFWPADRGYDWAAQTISDLGNTACAMYGGGFVCSPLHGIMNASFIVLGVTMVVGAFILRRELGSDWWGKLGFGSMILAGFGTLVVGLFPENTIGLLHTLGATLPFVFGNVGMVILGVALAKMPRWLRGYTVVSGVVGLGALALFVAQAYAGIGIGGMERLVAYPQSIWMMVFGGHVLLVRLVWVRGTTRGL